MRKIFFAVIALFIFSCSSHSIEIKLTPQKLTFEGKEVTIDQLTDQLKSITKGGDTPLVKLTVYEDATMGDINGIRNALREAAFTRVKQFVK
jgi:biopolymer transport protein ExbD